MSASIEQGADPGEKEYVETFSPFPSQTPPRRRPYQTRTMPPLKQERIARLNMLLAHSFLISITSKDSKESVIWITIRSRLSSIAGGNASGVTFYVSRRWTGRIGKAAIESVVSRLTINLFRIARMK